MNMLHWDRSIAAGVSANFDLLVGIYYLTNLGTDIPLPAH